MGATGWHYFVPYMENVETALELLQDAIFQQGRYYSVNPATRPESINELREMNGESGTHSILDVWAVEEKRSNEMPSEGSMTMNEAGNEESLNWYMISLSDIGKVFGLSRHDCMALLGTDKPSRSDAESKIDEIINTCSRWTGKYLVIYESEKPAELLFVGASGD